MSTTTFKTNLNSVSNGCSLASLKQHITTCLQRWRQKDHSIKHNKQHQQEEKVISEECYRNFQDDSSKWFEKTIGKDYSFVESFNSKLQKFISSQQKQHWQNPGKGNLSTYSGNKGPRKYGRKVEIVAKLLSTTLIAKSSIKTENSSQQSAVKNFSSFGKQIEIIHNSTVSGAVNNCKNNAMTITDLTFLEIRDEFPDLDAEIRSILTARAQDGATIPQIRDDYRKLTGLTFPIYEDVTEFLLTIPHVMAYCSEKGIRIFNIRPMDKTKHIHDMVMQQKPQLECLQKSSDNRYYYRERQRNNYQLHNSRPNSRILQHNLANIYVEPTARDYKQEQIIPTIDGNLSRNSSDELIENNRYYQDNCNYLFNRICNQQNLPTIPVFTANHHTEHQVVEASHKSAPLPPTAGTSTDLNNFYSDIGPYKNNINHTDNLYRFQRQEHQCQSNVNNLQTDVRRTCVNSYRNTMPKSSRSSTPTAKSCYTNDSVFADSDYEAHLLDFLLLGDDFFLYMARMELRCKFKKNRRILQSGLCVSGQTIGASIKRIRALSENRRSIILNIGSVDIMQGRQLIQIEHDFRELLLTMLKKGIRPILTTLAPLANYSHNKDIKHVLGRFNDFVKREGQKRNLVVIDIWKCLVNEKGHVLFDCYQNEPRNVTGTSESYLFWNKIGRQRVLQLIESNLEY